jgi:PKHD-type hydroxylase
VETAPRERGVVIAFPSYVLHRVTPITSGTRKSVVIWITGPKFK